MIKKDLLFEIGLEELPPKQISKLSEQLATQLTNLLTEQKLNYKAVKAFGSPRHLAVLISEVDIKQRDIKIEKKGPAVNVAYNQQGEVTPAALGFARSCGVNLSALKIKTLKEGDFIVHEYLQAGNNTETLLPQLCEQALKKLTIARPMRWGDTDIEFIRPIHWIVLLFGGEVVKANLYGVQTQRETYGHRFHHPQAISLKQAADYEQELQKAFVLVDFSKRRENIHQQIKEIATEMNAIAVIENDLLEEVTGLVEWPQALLVHFDEKFLQVPEEALISAMQTHQKAFQLIDKKGHLLANFITVSNINSKNNQQVISGNERVMRARLQDAAFFYHTDCQQSLTLRLEKLKGVIFQKSLGDLYARAQRLAELSKIIAKKLSLNTDIAYQAGLLAKADLVSDMVQEFPELQGIMGYYYALNDGLDDAVAQGIRDHYLPRFSGDNLPATDYACIVALADRLDKLVGIFGINQKPTGEKDPFALRRAALGILQIIIEKKYLLDLSELLQNAITIYQQQVVLSNQNAHDEILAFMQERLRFWYQEQKINNETFNAVNNCEITLPYDFHLRVHAVKQFLELPEAVALAEANKRVNNILNKESSLQQNLIINKSLLQHPAEKILAEKIFTKKEFLLPLIAAHDYQTILTSLAELQPAVDQFFTEVLVNVDDEKLRNNRFVLLQNLRNLFLAVADISCLAGKAC